MLSPFRAFVVTSLLVLVVFMFQHLAHRLVYYPMPYPEGDWNLQAEAGAQDVWLTTHDGIRLNAWWFPTQGARFATLFLHGNAGNVTHRIDHAQAIKAAGSAVLVVDYRGYGKSKGHPSEAGLVLDAEAAYDSLTQTRFQAEPNHPTRRVTWKRGSCGSGFGARVRGPDSRVSVHIVG